ncbi:hypothetical protein CAPTEDRAFT_226764 [Capitella teleta]|uniref:Sushi domain-containing protein n=1 Tax=Capitella teleta TaxID=283909 RepID=N1PB73_CAPTE|nr:hypothetical protein CAPTEDRAFT_226764 [Capitella teleta]|eukprot:ELU18856.1 hypothetical protein CAPTEDRAFT_226764 [Capitella teleta]
MFVDQDHECAKEQAPLPENARVLWQSFLDPDGYMYYLECDQGYQYLSSNEGLLFCNMTTGQWDDHHAGNCTEAPYESTTPSSLTTILYKETTIEAEADTTLTSARNALTSSTPPFASTSTLKSTATSFAATTGSATAPSDTTPPGAISGAVTGETDTIVPLAIGLGLSGLALFIIVHHFPVHAAEEKEI